MRHRFSRLPVRGALALAFASIALAGCVQTKPGKSVGLRAEQFADPGAGVAPEPESPPMPAPPPVEIREAIAPVDGVLDVTARPGAPVLTEADRAEPLGAPVLVDGTAGYVNNRAIYINEFLEPMAQRFRETAGQVPRAEWIQGVRDRIRQDVELLVQDELLLAEAMVQIAPTEEERRGLLSWFDRTRSSILSRFGGTPSAANEQLAQRDDEPIPEFGSNIQGRTVDEVLESIKRREMITYHLRSTVGTRAYVTWRDVLIAYQNRYDDFNPPPAVMMRMICVPASRTAEADEVRRALEAGEDFAAVASKEFNSYEQREGGRFVRQLDGPFETTQLIAIPALDRAFHALKPGEVAGPIEVGPDLYWIKLEEIRKNPRTLGLYEAQVALEGDLRQQRLVAEQKRHVERLKARASFTGIEEMTERLTAVAIERYNPAPQDGAPARTAGGR